MVIYHYGAIAARGSEGVNAPIWPSFYVLTNFKIIDAKIAHYLSKLCVIL